MTTEEVQPLAAELQEARAKLATWGSLIQELTDIELCWFDHNGGCQTHAYLSLKPGETCPMYDAQQISAALAGPEGVAR